MNARQFFDLVDRMREAQKRYQRTKSDTALKDKRKLESLVDEEIDRVNKLLEQPQNTLGI